LGEKISEVETTVTEAISISNWKIDVVSKMVVSKADIVSINYKKKEHFMLWNYKK